MKKCLILSPFAENGTKNSGDDLIVKSLIKLITLKKEEYKIISIAKSTKNKEKTFNETNIKEYNILFVPAFRISIKGQENFNIRLKYIEKAIINKIPIFVIGASWCIYPGFIKQTKLKINSHEETLLKYIVNNELNYLSARDIYTQKLLENNNIKCNLSGDLALYDILQIKNDLNFNKLNKIAISLPHNVNYYNYCMILKNKIEKIFKCKVYICTHQYMINNKKYIDLSCNSKNLDFYKTIDMHIGFRLHAHLWFLRNRKPTFLIAEDGRGYGHLKTFKDLGIHISKLADENIIKIIKEQINLNFLNTRKVLKKIDNIYYDEIELIRRKLCKILQEIK
jgi:hypothetical protein